jgi:hypothetical protein
VNTCPPVKCRTSRLVTSALRLGHCSSCLELSGPTPATCSKLLSTSKWFPLLNALTNAAEVSCSPPNSRMSSEWTIVGRTRFGSLIRRRSTNTMPSAKSAVSSAATAVASRVLPTPPGHVRVTSWTSGLVSRCLTAIISRWRPTRGVRNKGSWRGDRVDHVNVAGVFGAQTGSSGD